MTKGINKAIVLGRLGKDPLMSKGVANFSIATSQLWKNKEGKQEERTEWHQIVAFGRLAEIVNEYLKKGSLVYIEGRLETKSYDKEGQTHYSTKIVANEIQMLGDKKSNGVNVKNKGNSEEFDDDLPF